MGEVGLFLQMHMGAFWLLILENLENQKDTIRQNKLFSADIGAYTLERNFIIPLTTAVSLYMIDATKRQKTLHCY